jgi:hypothetical protein
MAEGGCLCGAVRYRVDGAPLDAGYCHCRMCQRSTGAPVVAWATWPEKGFKWTAGSPRLFVSSSAGRRWHCPACGTHILFVHAQAPDLRDITLASLDDPTAFRPEYHIWTASRIAWFETADASPRHADGGPDDQLMATFPGRRA